MSESAEFRRRVLRLVASVADRPPVEAEIELRVLCDESALFEACRKLLHDERRLRDELDANPFQEHVQFVEEAAESVPVPTASGLAIGARLGGFELVKLLGVGATSHVYRARSASLDRDVALKILPLSERRNAGSFAREAAALSRLRHPDIVTVHDAGQVRIGEHEFGWIAMEIAEGLPITDALRGRVWREKAAIASRLCRAVEHAHQRGVIHCDLKPGHVRVVGADRDSGKPCLRILDFGISRILDSEAATMMTGTPGTIGYMSPEQRSADPAEIDIRSDVYSLGVIVYELLAGEPVFRLSGKTLAGALAVMESHRPDGAAMARAGVPDDLGRIALKALTREKDSRYANAGAMADDLDRWLSGRPILAQRTSGPRRAYLWARRNRLVSLLTLTTLLGVIVGVVGLGVSVVEARRREREVERERDRLVEALGLLRRYVGRLDELGGTLAERATTLEQLRVLLDTPRLSARSDPDLVRSLADVLDAQADVLEEQGDTKVLMAHSRRVVRLREDLATAPSSMPEDRADLALAWIKLGDVQYRDRFETEGFASYNTALGILEPLAREFPESRRFADDLAHSYSRLAIKNWGRRDEAACRGLLAKATAQREMLERKFPGHATTWRTSAELQLTDCSLWIAMSNGPCEEADRAREGSLAALSKLLAMRPRNRHDLELAIWIQRNAANGFAIGSERYTAIRRDAMASLSKLMAEDPHRPELWWEYLFEALMMAESLCIAGNPDQAATELEVTADALAGAPLQARHWVQQSHAWKERLGWIRGKYGTAVDTALGKVEASVTRVE